MGFHMGIEDGLGNPRGACGRQHVDGVEENTDEHCGLLVELWWRVKDLHLRRTWPADLQSAPVGYLGNPPKLRQENLTTLSPHYTNLFFIQRLDWHRSSWGGVSVRGTHRWPSPCDMPGGVARTSRRCGGTRRGESQ